MQKEMEHKKKRNELIEEKYSKGQGNEKEEEYEMNLKRNERKK